MSKKHKNYKQETIHIIVNKKKLELWLECSRDLKLMQDSIDLRETNFQVCLLKGLLERIRMNLEGLHPDPNFKPDYYIPF